MQITKETILQKINSYEILNHYLQPFHNKGAKLRYGVNISNPLLLPKIQETPSFNIFHNSANGEWRYKDFATGDEGNGFDLVMKLFNIDFKEALNKINSDFNLQLDAKQENFDIPPPDEKIETLNFDDFTIVKKTFTVNELAYWLQYSITMDTLKKFNVCALKSYSAKSKSGKPYTISADETNFIFVYDHSNWFKIYKPNDTKFRFQHLGNKPPEFIFGWQQLPQKGETVFLTGGEKDVMSLAANGFNAIALNSETATLPPTIATELKQRFKNVIILYDNDKTGLEQSEKIANSHQLQRIVLPEIENGKDISDFFKAGNTAALLTSYMEQDTLQSEEKIIREVGLVSAFDLIKREALELPCLWQPFLPQVALAAIVGSSDSGKSAFARQLAIAVIARDKSFLGFDLNQRYYKVLYISSEDDANATSMLLKKQLKGRNVPDEYFKNLDFIFESEETIKQLNKLLLIKQYDLIVLDAYGDIYDGKEGNASSQVRPFLNEYAKLANKYGCLCLFIHHVGKRTEQNEPSKHNAIGSQSFEAKMRVLLDLRTDEYDNKHLSVVKGNYLSREFKKASYVLHFNEDNLSFSNTKERTDFKDLGSKENNRNKYEVNWVEVFGDQKEVKKSELIKKLEVLHLMPYKTAIYYIEKNLTKGIKQGYYQISLPTPQRLNPPTIQEELSLTN